MNEPNRVKYEKVYALYEKKVYSIALKILKNKEDAEDSKQNTFLKIWKLIDRIYDDIENPVNLSFIVSIATTTSIDLYRKKNGNANLYTRLGNEESLKSYKDVLEELIKKDNSLRLRKALEDVDYQSAHILIMKYVYGLTHTEIAKSLGISESASWYRIHKAKKIMRNDEEIKKLKKNWFIFFIILIVLTLAACVGKVVYDYYIKYSKDKESAQIIRFYADERPPFENLEIQYHYIPDGYTLREETSHSDNYTKINEYKNDKGGVFSIIFESSGFGEKYVDTENGKVTEYEIKMFGKEECKYKGTFIEFEDKEDYFYLLCKYGFFEYHGNLEISELIKIVENIVITEH